MTRAPDAGAHPGTAVPQQGPSAIPREVPEALPEQRSVRPLSLSTVARSRGAQLNRVTGLLLWAVFIAFFAVRVPSTFLTSATFNSIAGDQSVTVILALGLLVTLAAGQFDLSAAQNLGLCAVIDSELMVHHHLDPVLASLLTLAVGAGIGLVNGVLVAVVGVNSFIATLGMSSVLLAFTEQLSGNQFVGPVPAAFQKIASHSLLGVPIAAVYAMILAALVWYVLEHTPAGRRTYAVGANPDAARLAGVRTTRYVIASFVVTAVFAALAGILATAKIGEVAPTLGPGYMLPAFAACFLGATQLKLGRFNVWGAVIALYLLATGVKGLQLIGSQLWVTDLFNGVALIAAVSVAVLSGKRRPRRAKARAAANAAS
ncbi:ABC transporter permease [Streptomyces sp. NPDC059455]|uniref:ABC transporter permease n=1 Tax=Streptomyces sp. NPDC059455 TaxID=3346837 RepID=UPI00369A3B32